MTRRPLSKLEGVGLERILPEGWIYRKNLDLLVRSAGFEPATLGKQR